MLSRFSVLIAVTLPLVFAADVRVVEEIAAKVNGDIITRGELDQTRKELEAGLRQEGLTGTRLQEELRNYAANALRDQIDQLLLVQRGKDLNINVDPDITREVADIQVRSKITDPDKFHEYIREQTGMTYEDYRDRLKRQYLSQRVIGQEVGYRINIPEPELHKYYDEHKAEFVRKDQVFLSQILISTEGKTPEQVAAAEKKAKDLVARANKGDKFSDLVRDNSDDPETARNGGSLPGLQREQLDAQIAAVVFKEKKGFVAGPFKRPQGFLILKIDERYEAGQASFEEVKSEIQDRLAKPKMEPKIREYLTNLRQQAFLEIKDGYIDSGAAPGKDTRWHDVATLKPQTTTKEEVAARVKKHKKVLFIPIPGTNKKAPADSAQPQNPAGTTPTQPPAGTAPTQPSAQNPPPAAAPVKQ
jgi:peptidyl-prolyl cis-trans isomerase SurA